MTRTERAEKARQTLEYFHKGFYTVNGEKIPCQSFFDTEFITESQLEALSMPNNNFKPTYEVVNESVIDTIFRIGRDTPNCIYGILNFASAKNPGGGFLNGAVAQEEALAISSDLYNSQLQAPKFYESNRRFRSSLYLHNMIYSHGIKFIRDAQLNTVRTPVIANVLTLPAVNAGAYYKNEKGSKSTVISVMETRIRYILKLFAAKGNRTIVLGAFGCGVFGNDPADVAGIFYKLLKEENLEKQFEHIIFAIYDPKGQQYNIFKRKFNS